MLAPHQLSTQLKYDWQLQWLQNKSRWAEMATESQFQYPQCTEPTESWCGGQVQYCKASASPALSPEGSDPDTFFAADLQQSTSKSGLSLHAGRNHKHRDSAAPR